MLESMSIKKMWPDQWVRFSMDQGYEQIFFLKSSPVVYATSGFM